MGPQNRWRDVFDWVAMLPVRLAFRLVWLVALLGHRDARAVYQAMWDAELDLPSLGKNCKL